MADLPVNLFKKAIANGEQQIGLWCMLPDPYLTEILCNAGFDWVLIDTEHSPSDLRTVSSQLSAARGAKTSVIVRPAANDTVLIKQYLDIGAQTLLIPMVNNAQEARDAVAAMRYPPEGVRGVAGMTRASQFGRIPDYHKRAASELCLLVQVESKQALDEIEAIAAVDGVDGIFIGPADLAASLGFPGQQKAPEVVLEIENAIARIRAAGKPAGILSFDEEFLRHCIGLGTLFTAVGGDMSILLNGAENLAKNYQDVT